MISPARRISCRAVGPAAIDRALLYAGAVRHVLPRGQAQRRLTGPARRPVFVVGCPRSGTTFTGRTLGAHPGLVDLGEVKPHKAAVFTLTRLPEQVAAARIRRTLELVRRLALVHGLGFVEQTPETCFVLGAALRAYPEAHAVHVVRDGRDVVCSLLERGWLRDDRTGRDDVGAGFGAHVRPWVEPDRASRFAEASEATRAAWAWRRHVQAAHSVDSDRVVEIRYEQLVGEPAAAAQLLAERLDLDAGTLERGLGSSFDRSVGRWQRDLTPEQLADVEREAGPLLRELGYE